MSLLNEKKVPEDTAELRVQQEAARRAWEKLGELKPSERQLAAEEWAAGYGHLFYWCCGSPVFGGAEAEQYYAESAYYKRGDLGGSKVGWS